MSTRLERRLTRSLAREKAMSRAKDEFLAALSHELRVPLNPVLLLASDGYTNRDLPPRVRSDFNAICKNIEVEARLIDDLLDLTRIARRKLILKRSLVDVHSALQHAASMFEHEISEKQIFLKMRFGAAHHHINADLVRLKQVFWNVLRNAVKFTTNRGQIVLDTDSIEKHLVINVTDSGIGMTRDEIKNIFNGLSQGTHCLGGLGLGLAISRKLVEMHNGSIRAFSLGKGKGATFLIKLPFVRTPGTSEKPDQPPDPPQPF